jgi:hypothetical protein
MTTHEVHSSLEAVGFIARPRGWLAGKEMEHDNVSKILHDHLFVLVERAEEAVRVLAVVFYVAGVGGF